MSHQQAQSKQDPASARACELAQALCDGKKDAIPKLLDPTVTMDDITGRVSGPDAVGAALQLLCELVHGHVELEPTRTDRDLKSARFVWCVHGLRFEDTVMISSSLLITRIARQKVESKPVRSAAERAAGKRFLQALVGMPAAKDGKGTNIDNKQRTFPVLDFSYHHIERPRQLLICQPRAGRRYVGKQAQDKKEEARLKEEAEKREAELKQSLMQEEELEPQQIVIKGRSRDGESAAYAFDRTEMKRTALGTAEQGESDDETAEIKEDDRMRWQASAVKLQGNSLTGSGRLEEVLKRICVHAFYHLTWIDLSCNNLVTIPDFSQFPLVVLYLHANKIDDMKEVQKLKGLEELQSLTLFGNPIQDHVRSYKVAVLNQLCPRDGRAFSLKKFDFSVLSKDDTSNMETLHEFTTVAAQNNRLRRKNQMRTFGPGSG